MGIGMGPACKLVPDLSLFVKSRQVGQLSALPEIALGNVDVALFIVQSRVHSVRPTRADRVLDLDSGNWDFRSRTTLALTLSKIGTRLP